MVMASIDENTMQGDGTPRAHSNVLELDAHTLKDLEIFESGAEHKCLFEFCNLTRTNGGAKMLRRRMESPSSDFDSILATQKSVSFILAHRAAFVILPSAYVANIVDQHYTHEILPLVVHENIVEFSYEVVAMWANHDRHHFSIVRGVQVTCGLIQTLRRFVEQSELALITGELALFVEEMRSLLAIDRIARVPDKSIGSQTWKILRLDQVFRLHEKSAIERLLKLVYEIDALVAMADVTQKHDFVLPTMERGPLAIQAEGLVHPFLPEAIPNPVSLDQQRRVLFLTGPNMAGKTTYLRAFATGLYLAHLGMGVPAQRFRFVPAQRLFSSISLNDDLNGGISYFRAEALRVKAVAEAVAQGYRVVALMDEPFKGTNVKDALDASLAIMERFATKQDCVFMFSSHLIELGEKLSVNKRVDCRYFEAQDSGGRLRFDYQLNNGVSSQRLGMRVLQEEGIFDLLDEIPKTV